MRAACRGGARDLRSCHESGQGHLPTRQEEDTGHVRRRFRRDGAAPSLRLRLYEWIAPTEERTGGGDDKAASSAPSGKMGRARAVAIHILLDNFVMVFLYVALMMAVTSLLEGRILTFIPEMKEGYFTAVRASMQVSLLGYAPVEFMSFYSLPRNLRVLAVSVSVCRLCSSGPHKTQRVQSGWRIEPDSRLEFTIDFSLEFPSATLII